MTINVRLSSDGINSAIQSLRDYQSTMSARLNDLVGRLGQVGVSVINAQLLSAAYAGAKGAISVRTEFTGNTSCVIRISGEKVAFIEFGAGVRFPEGDYSAAADACPHGTYGMMQGANPKGWVYKGEEGTGGYSIPVMTKRGEVRPGVWRTWGNPPANSVTAGVTEIQRQVDTIVREVFST